jgi:Ca-activated chloride channel family protein
MSFGNPLALWALLALAGLIVLDLLRQGTVATRWPGISRLWAGRDAVDLRTPATKPRARWLFWSGLVLVVLALAQPRFGAAEVPVDQTPREVLVALDLSRSMLARDVRPSRLEHAKLLVRGLLDKLAGERAGLALFASTSYLQIPLSEDYESISMLLPGLTPAAFPRSGTDFSAMLRTGLDAFSNLEGVQRYLVVLSDGESFNENWKPLLADYKKRGIHIVAVGVGTAGGAVIPGDNDAALRDPATGLEAITRFRSATMQALATETQGQYLEANTWTSLADVIRKLDAGVKKEAVTRKSDHLLVERYRWLLVPAVVLLWISFCGELPVRPATRRFAGGLPLEALRKGGAALAGSNAAASAAALLVLLAVWQPRLGAAPEEVHRAEQAASDLAEQQAAVEEDDDPSGRPAPVTRIGGMVSRRIAEILAKPAPSADDYTALVIDMMAYAENNLKARQRFPNSVIEDALAAIDRGAALDAQGGDWTSFRTELVKFHAANNSPWKLAQADAAGKSDLATGFDPDHDIQTNGQGSGGVASSDPAERQAMEEMKRKIGQNAAFGTMGDERKKPAGSAFDEAPPPPPDSHLVGGHNHEEEHEIEAHPELVLPLQRLALVRAQDTPAKLFQMLEGTDNSPLLQGPEW